ncbi:MAG: toxin-antitoxin system HicB family antitoxin [Gammaproteobacteria bacterium]|jgi:predicted HicB family RNase H-like nuclease
MTKKEFDGFSVNIYLDEDGDWLAHFVELPSISACGDTAEEALRELKIAWNAAKKSYRKHGEKIPVALSQKKFSGHLNVRIDKRVHRHLAMEAALAKVSLNALIAQKLLLTTTEDNFQ